MILKWPLTREHDHCLECEGLNNSGKCKEIRSRLNRLNPDVVILVETIVNLPKVEKTRHKLVNKWSCKDNHTKHNNMRIWILWDESKVKVINLNCAA